MNTSGLPSKGMPIPAVGNMHPSHTRASHSNEIEQQTNTETDIEQAPHVTAEHRSLVHKTSDITQQSNTQLSFRQRLSTSLKKKDTTPCTYPAAAAAPISIPPATKAPKDTLKAVYAAGKYKAGLTLNVLIVQSFMAGIYIAFAGQLYLTVGGGVLGSSLFPGGLVAVSLTSAELFTGDALVFVAAVLGKQVPVSSLLRNWTVSWISNFVGSLCWAFFLGYLCDALVDVHAEELAVHVAEKKANNELYAIFIKAIGANFMVCVAVWQATCAEEVAGKVLALWFPTAAFVMMGFDHVVANMFLIPMGMMLGANVSVGRLFAALAMATMGNAIGGGIFVGGVYWYVFDSMASFGELTARIRHGMGHIPRNRTLNRAGGSSFQVGRGNHPPNPRAPPVAQPQEYEKYEPDSDLDIEYEQTV